MAKITLKDGSIMELEQGLTALDAAKQISEGLARNALACEIDGQVKDLMTPITEDCTLNILTFQDEMGRWTLRHTCAHILAQAMKRLHPEVKLAIGPAIDNGFYYDFDAPEPFTEDQLGELEAEMRKICKEKLKLERFELPREEAIRFMEEKGEPYKVELIQDLPEDAVISFYKQGEFVDLCAGPHIPTTGRVKGNAIKLTTCNAAYWRGDSSRATLQRVYGTAFPSKDELDAYLEQAGRSQAPGPPEAGPGTGPVYDDRGRPRLPLLPAPGHGAEKHLAGLLAGMPQALRLCRRSPPPSSSTKSCGTAAATGIITKTTCTPPRSTRRITLSSP